MKDVTEDNGLLPEEKEVMIRFDKRDKSVCIHSEVGSVSKALRGRNDFEQTGARTNSEGEIVSVTGNLPLGVLKISKNARKNELFSTIVSTK